MDFILGTDPDSDRVGIMVRDKDGEYKVMTGNQTGVVLLDYLLGAMERTGKLPKNPVALNGGNGARVGDHGHDLLEERLVRLLAYDGDHPGLDGLVAGFTAPWSSAPPDCGAPWPWACTT